MTPEALSSLADVAQTLGVVGVMVFVGWAFYTRRLRLGSDYQDMEEDRNWWRNTALKGLSAGEKAVTVAERKTRTSA